MIVISGALVLVALILLVLGVTLQELDFVLYSIGVSLVSLLFLVIGVLQRRGQPAPSRSAPAPVSMGAGGAGGYTPREEARPAPATSVRSAPAPATARTTVMAKTGSPRGIPAKSPVAAAVVRPAEPDYDEQDYNEQDYAEQDYAEQDYAEQGGVVLVVSGRPRYHADGCRYLSSKDAEELDVLEAREEGFTPCGVCKPDLALAAAREEEFADEEYAEEDYADEEYEDDEPAQEVEEQPVVQPIRPAARSKVGSMPRQAASAPSRSVAAAASAPMSRFSKPAPPAREAPTEYADPAPAAAAAPRTRGASKSSPAVAAPGKAPARSVGKPAAAPSAERTSAKVVGKPGAAGLARDERAGGVGRSAAASSAQAAPSGGSAPPRVAKSGGARAPVGRPVVPAKPGAAVIVPTAGLPAAARTRRAGSVVVVPGRPRFHRPDCRFVRDAEDAEMLSTAKATKQGFRACGTCKP